MKASAYRAALTQMEREAADLEARIRIMQNERVQFEGAMQTLRSRIAAIEGQPYETLRMGAITPGLAEFTNLTVRDAIKKLLGEFESRAMTTAEITAGLERGGIRTRGRDFLSNVSATLSMMAKKEEVVREEDGWRLLFPSEPVVRPPEDGEDVKTPF